MPKSGNGNMLGRYTHSWTIRSLLAATAVVLCLAPLRAQDVAAKAITVSGQVSLLKDGNPWALNEGDTVKPKQIIVTGRDGYAQFRVADGSTFEVFQNAKVTFRENYPSWTDLVQVWLGRIRVQIEHRLGANPNSVSTPTAVISVRGTIFDVVVEDEDDTTLVSVEEGLVDVQHKLKYGPVVRLNPGESIRVFRNQPLARMVDKDPAVRAGLNAVKQAIWEIVLRRPTGGGTAPTSTTTGGAQGDQKKNGGKGTPGAPGAPGSPTGGG